MLFTDRAKVMIASGQGGNGMSSFRREKYVPRGGPSGGDGGRGGDVIAEASSDMNTLQNFRYHRKFQAKNGENGGSKNQYGKDAQPVVIQVPLGTMIYDADTNDLLADLTEDGQRVVLARGGHGGRGNSHFATSAVRAPTYAEKGEMGEEKNLRLELKVLADVGLIGFPSVGKSSFLRKVSAAKPQVAAYHFTTLTPILGVVQPDPDRTFVMADIPGLIEGASAGAGLGDDFLRHVERTRVLIHVLDASGSEGRDPVHDFSVINEELALYNPELAHKKQLVAANKIDMIDDPEKLKDIQKKITDMGYECYPVSALSGEGIRPLIERVWKLLQEIPAEKTADESHTVVYEDSKKDEFTVERNPDGSFELKGRRIERLVSMIGFDDDQALMRFQKAWKYMGLDKLLKSKGVREGNTVRVSGMEFTYSESGEEQE